MPKNRKSVDHTPLALEALKVEGVKAGAFIATVDEGEDTFSYLFKSELKGYLDWHWSVTIYQPEGQEPTVSELVLLPGENSLIAPDWVPWSERLADYKALQAELEAQAALDALEAEESEDDVEEVDESDEIVDVDVDEDLFTAVSDEGEDPKDDSDDAGVRPPRSRGRYRRGKSKKND